jgi:16S rRNA (cytidine1402-2'-O)-methyltransferase
MRASLFLIPNLLGVAAPEDVLPARTIREAQRINHFIVETPKVARAFLKSLSPNRLIADVQMVDCHDRNAIATCLSWLNSGNDVGVISDAGCPGMADPGAAFVAAGHAANFKIVPLVGPSSLLLGLMASGLNGQHVTFCGYLPAKTEARDSVLRRLERTIKATGATQAFIETPYRNAPLIDAIQKNVTGDIALCVAQNLASTGEHIVAKALNAWTKHDVDAVSAKEPALFLLGRFASP